MRMNIELAARKAHPRQFDALFIEYPQPAMTRHDDDSAGSPAIAF
jgi:hypothetical protein